MKATWISLVLLLQAATGWAVDDLSTVLRWYVDTEKPVTQPLILYRGESVVLEPTFLNYNQPVDLSSAYTVDFRYQPVNETNWFYMLTGSVYSASEGKARVRWSNTAEPPDNAYRWQLVIAGPTSTMVRAFGSLSLQTKVNGIVTTNNPARFTVLDFATVQLLNLDRAPFLSSYEIDQISTYIDSIREGSGNIDASNITARGSAALTDVSVSGTLLGSASGLTNFPSYLARASDGEFSQTNRLLWRVNGETVGYVDSNGVTLVKGSIQLFEDDLNCNVRAYDGSQNEPSMTFLNSPDRGWYSKSVDGNYAWAFAVNSNTVFYITSNRLQLASNVIISGAMAFTNYLPRRVSIYTLPQELPRYFGEIVADEDNLKVSIAMGLYSSNWLELASVINLTNQHPSVVIPGYSSNPKLYTPRWSGDLLIDEANGRLYVSVGSTTNHWKYMPNSQAVNTAIITAIIGYTQSTVIALSPQTWTNWMVGGPTNFMPRFVGDRLIFTTTNKMWQSNGVNSNNWLQIFP